MRIPRTVLGKLSLKRQRKTLMLAGVLAAIALLQACGGNSNSSSFAGPTSVNPAQGVNLQSISIAPSTSIISLAETRQLTAIGSYSDGGISDLTSQVQWQSSSPHSTVDYVSVSPSGMAKGVSLGTANVTATLGSVTGVLQLTVGTSGFSSTTIGILPVPYKSTVIDAAYLPEAQSLIQGAYAVQEVNLDADQFSTQVPVQAALLASIPMPPGFKPNATAASPSSSLVAVISYSSPDIQIIDASNVVGDVNNNLIINTFTAPVTKKATFYGPGTAVPAITCMICAAVVDPANNQLLLSTAQGYFYLNLTTGSFTALPLTPSPLPAASFALNPNAQESYIVSPTGTEVQFINLATNAVISNTTLGPTNPSTSAIDITNNDVAIGDAGGDDQSLVYLADLQNPLFTPVPGLGGCTNSGQTANMSMLALGISAIANATQGATVLYMAQPGGSCFGFEAVSTSFFLDLTQSEYGYAPMPDTPDGSAFLNYSDPNAITNFNSVVDKKNYGVLLDASENWIAKVNPQIITGFTTPGPLPSGLDVSSFLGTAAPYNSVIYLPTPASMLALSQTNINFGTQAVGTASALNTVTLTNIGANPVSISSIALKGSNAADFTESDGCANSLLFPQAKCTINLTFAPTAAGPASASVSITDDGGTVLGPGCSSSNSNATGQIICLSGTGQ
jgi:hypothetical protein